MDFFCRVSHAAQRSRSVRDERATREIRSNNKASSITSEIIFDRLCRCVLPAQAPGESPARGIA